MSNRQLAEGVFRAWAVIWAIDTLIAVPQFLNGVIRTPYSGNEKAMEAYFLSSQAISIGCSIIVVLFLFRKAAWLASLVFPAEQELGLGFTADDLRAVLFAAVGLYFLIDGLRYVIGISFALLVRNRGEPDAFGYLWHQQPENLVRAVVSTALGAVVLFRRRGGPGFWARIKASYEKKFGLRELPDER
jgi:hypothetical protein